MDRPASSPILRRRCAFGRLLALGTVLALGVTIAPAAAQVPGPNVNMISIDKYLQKQNEIDVTISPMNPCHIVGAANDYRTVNNRGLNTDLEYGDSWIGMYVSTDCGETWLNYLVPGYVQGIAGADPMPRFGPGGALYLSYMTFTRGTNFGTVSVARYLDYNDIEGVPGPPTEIEDTHNPAYSPVRYLGRTVFAQGSNGRFNDKPSVAAVPVSGPACSVSTPEGKVVTIPATNVYVAWTVFLSNSDVVVRSKVYFARSTNCGQTLAGPAIKLSESIPVNQGTVIAVNPSNSSEVYVAWRQVADGKNPDRILLAKSIDGGRTFTKATPVTFFDGVTTLPQGVPYKPFDQATTATTFRTIGYPTMVMADNGRLYLAASARIGELQNGTLPDGTPMQAKESRILVTSTRDGLVWEPPATVDPGLATEKGQQVMPALAYAGGRLNLIWYDLRDDKAVIFKAFVDEKDAESSPNADQSRHTLDVRGAQASVDQAGGPQLTWTVYGVSQTGPGGLQKVSQYLFGIDPPLDPAFKQRNFNRGNLKLYSGGGLPFMGDYIGTAGVQYLPSSAQGQWVFNGIPSGTNPGDAVRLTFQTAWTDNRDAIVGEAGDGPGINPSLDYTPPGSANCDPKKANSRNANVYTSRVTPGLYISILGNTKPTDIQRAFAIQVENGTGDDMTGVSGVTLSLLPDVDATASFEQCLPPSQCSPVTSIQVDIGKLSSIARTVYVQPKSGTLYPRVRVQAAHGNLSAIAYINADPQNPPVQQPGNTSDDVKTTDTHTPRVQNPRVQNSGPATPRVQNPRVQNQDVPTPAAENNSIKTPRVQNATVENPRVQNGSLTAAPFSDITYDVTNDGNTISAFDLQVRTAPVSTYAFQLFGWRAYRLPIEKDCQLVYTEVPQDLFNVPTGVGSPTLKEATAVVRPGETIKLTLRAYYTGDDPANTFKPFCKEPGDTTPDVPPCLDVTQVTATAQAINVGEVPPATVPESSTLGTSTPLPDLAFLEPIYGVPERMAVGDMFQVVTRYVNQGSAPATGFGTAIYVSPTSAPSGTPLNPTDGETLGVGAQRFYQPEVFYLADTPPGLHYVIMSLDYQGLVTESDETNNIAGVPIQVVTSETLRVTTAYDYACLNFASNTITLGSAGGVDATRTWSVIGDLPSGLTFNAETGVISGQPTVPVGVYTVTVQVTDGAATASQVLAIRVVAGCPS